MFSLRLQESISVHKTIIRSKSDCSIARVGLGVTNLLLSFRIMLSNKSFVCVMNFYAYLYPQREMTHCLLCVGEHGVKSGKCWVVVVDRSYTQHVLRTAYIVKESAILNAMEPAQSHHSLHCQLDLNSIYPTMPH